MRTGRGREMASMGMVTTATGNTTITIIMRGGKRGGMAAGKRGGDGPVRMRTRRCRGTIRIPARGVGKGTGKREGKDCRLCEEVVAYWCSELGSNALHLRLMIIYRKRISQLVDLGTGDRGSLPFRTLFYSGSP